MTDFFGLQLEGHSVGVISSVFDTKWITYINSVQLFLVPLLLFSFMSCKSKTIFFDTPKILNKYMSFFRPLTIVAGKTPYLDLWLKNLSTKTYTTEKTLLYHNEKLKIKIILRFSNL